MKQDTRHAQALLHAAAQTIYFGIGLVVQVSQVKHIANGALALVAVNSIARGKELQVLVDQHVVVRAHEVRNKANDRPYQWVLVANGLAVNPRLSPRGLQEGRQDLDGGGLPGTVWPDEAAACAFFNLQIEIVQCNQVTVLLSEVDRLNHRHGSFILEECPECRGSASVTCLCWISPVAATESWRRVPQAAGIPHAQR